MTEPLDNITLPDWVDTTPRSTVKATAVARQGGRTPDEAIDLLTAHLLSWQGWETVGDIAVTRFPYNGKWIASVAVQREAELT